MKHRGRAHRSQRAASGVPDDGVGRVPATGAREPRTIREIDVLVHHEERFVEPAELVEERARDQECRAARAEDLARSQEFVRGRSVAPLVGAARAQVAVSGAVDDVRVIQRHDARRGQLMIGVLDACGMQAREPVRSGDRVVVEECEQRSGRGARGPIVAGGESEIGLVVHDPDGWKRGRHESQGAVRRSIVGEDRLERWSAGLRGQRREAGPQKITAVVVQHDDGDRGGHALLPINRV